ncbi:MAG TPA: LysR family transcriptional regulator [Candidatus Binatia bacterium]|jgi:DNA-binding transcriptional LysR family regulator
MTLHQLRIFITVAKHLNVTRASEELHIAQSALSRQLNLLTEECGAVLYRVIPRGVELTEEGKCVVSGAGTVLSQVESIKNDCRHRRKGGTVRIGGSHSPSLYFLPLLCAAYLRTYPGLEIDFRTGASPEIEQLTLKSEIEIGLITGPSHRPSLTYEPCRRERLVAFSSFRYPLKKQRLTVSELAQLPLVIERGCAGEGLQPEGILKQIEERGLTPKVVMKCDSSLAVKAAVKAGVGIGILFRDMVEAEVKRRELKVIRVTNLEMDTGSFVIYVKDRPLSPEAQQFLLLLRQRQEKTQCVLGKVGWA